MSVSIAGEDRLRQTRLESVHGAARCAAAGVAVRVLFSDRATHCPTEERMAYGAVCPSVLKLAEFFLGYGDDTSRDARQDCGVLAGGLDGEPSAIQPN